MWPRTRVEERSLENSASGLRDEAGAERCVDVREGRRKDTRPPHDAIETLRLLLKEDLGFHGTNGRFATHGWHPFPAKFPPQLPQFFIEGMSEPGQVVLDPMSGSGTTLVEAQRLGRRAIGCDIDPLARLISSAKLDPVAAVAVLKTGLTVLEQAQFDYWNRRSELEAGLASRFDEKTLEFLNYWFPVERQLELLSLIKQIEEIPDLPMRRFLEVVFSSTIIAKSGGVSLARDLAHTRPHRVLDKAPQSAFMAFVKRLKGNLAQDDRTSAEFPAQVLAATASATGLPDGSVDLIVTSPPYANNAIDYMRAHKFSLVWFGWKLDDLTELRKTYLGHDAKGGQSAATLTERCESTLARLGSLDERKANVLRRYFCEMAGVLEEMRRVLRIGGTAVVVVGTSTLRGLDVETHKALDSIAEHLGFACAGIGVRRLDRDKRMMPARWGNAKQSQIENRMHEEYAIGLVKP